MNTKTFEAERLEQRDSGFGFEPLDAVAGQPENALVKTPPPNYLVLRSNSLKPERLVAFTDDEAKATLTRQVRSSTTRVVYLYKLIGAEVFVPSSEFVNPEDIKDKVLKD